MTQRAPFGSQPGEIASFDLALALRRRECERAAAAERVREKIRSREARRARLRAAFLGLIASRNRVSSADVGASHEESKQWGS